MHRLQVFIVVLASVFCTAAFAKDKEAEPAVKADTADKFAQTVEQIHKEMAPKGRYEYITPARKSELDSELGQMSALMQKNGSVAAMPSEDRVKLFNAQEKVNAILTDNDSGRLICTKVAPVGSHIPVTKCRTYGEIASQRRTDQKFLQDNVHTLGCQNAACTRGGGGGG